MKKALSLILMPLLLGGIFVGCESKTGTGALVGTALGAGAGAIIGHQSGHRSEGALAGAAVGALGGALVGSEMDKKEEREQHAEEVEKLRSERANIEAHAGEGKNWIEEHYEYKPVRTWVDTSYKKRVLVPEYTKPDGIVVEEHYEERFVKEGHWEEYEQSILVPGHYE